MDSPGYTARRAAAEDLPALTGLWLAAGLPAGELEPFIGEFQVAVDTAGDVAAAVGLMVRDDEALLHSEAAKDAGDDAARAALWRRVQIISRNQGARRLWTREDAPYWMASGFRTATQEDFAAGRPSFVDEEPGWSVFPLADPARAEALAREQMALWEAGRQQEAEAFRSRVGVFRAVAYVVFAAVVVLVLVFLGYFMRLKGGGR